MRFMIIVRSIPEFEAETIPATPDEALFAAMATYHEELARAGVLLDAAGLLPSRAPAGESRLDLTATGSSTVRYRNQGTDRRYT